MDGIDIVTIYTHTSQTHTAKCSPVQKRLLNLQVVKLERTQRVQADRHSDLVGKNVMKLCLFAQIVEYQQSIAMATAFRPYSD